MFYNVCYDGKEHNGVLRESKRNAEIQIIRKCSVMTLRFYHSHDAHGN
jgi:hypothetical protein